MSDEPQEVTRPTIGRIVIYRSRTLKEEFEPQAPPRSAYSLPAIVAATVDSLYGPAVAEGHVRDITDPYVVHLVVFTCGDATLGGNDGGTYQEFAVPYSDDERAPGTWGWPPRV